MPVKKTLISFLLAALFIARFPAAFALKSECRICTRGPSALIWPCGLPFEDPGYRVYGPDGSERGGLVRSEGEVCTWRVGDYTRRYVLMDGERELSSAVLTVHVVPQNLPEIAAPPKGTICLTFDDGPCENTAEVLEVLAKYNVKACFFVVGFQQKYLDILSRIVAEGHTLGIHCYDHRAYRWLYQSAENYFSDLMQVQQIIYDRTGTVAHVLRFPGGSRTASFLAGALEGGYPELYGRLADLGIRAYDWNVQPESGTKTTEGTIINFTHPTEPYEYAVVLQHDTRYFSVKALERMIQWALSEGYTFAALDASFPEIHFCE